MAAGTDQIEELFYCCPFRSQRFIHQQWHCCMHELLVKGVVPALHPCFYLYLVVYLDASICIWIVAGHTDHLEIRSVVAVVRSRSMRARQHPQLRM